MYGGVGGEESRDSPYPDRRDSCDEAVKPRRTGSPAFAGDDSCGYFYAGNQPRIIGRKKMPTLMAKPMLHRIERSVGRSPR